MNNIGNFIYLFLKFKFLLKKQSAIFVKISVLYINTELDHISALLFKFSIQS